MGTHRFRKSAFFRTVSFFLLLTFPLTNVSFAGGGVPVVRLSADHEEDIKTKGENLSPVARIFFANDPELVAEWELAFESLNVDRVVSAKQITDSITGMVVEHFVKLWFAKQKRKLWDIVGREKAPVIWKNFVKNELLWEIVLSRYLSIVARGLMSQHMKAVEFDVDKYRNQYESLKPLLVEAADKFRKQELSNVLLQEELATLGLKDGGPDKSHGIETVRTGSDDPLSSAEAASINRAIAATIEAMKQARTYREVYDVRTGGSFVPLADEIYNRFAEEFGAPGDVECHPGTCGTAAKYKAGTISLDGVTKRYYIRQSRFKTLSPEDRKIIANHENLHIMISLGEVNVPPLPEGMKEEDWINTQPGCDVTAIKDKIAYIEALTGFLGEYEISEARDELPWGYEEYVIDLEKSPLAKAKLAGVFKEEVRDGEEYYILYFRSVPIGIVKKRRDGGLRIEGIENTRAIIEKSIPLHTIVKDISAVTGAGIESTTDLLFSDYLYFKERAKKGVQDRLTATYSELAAYQHRFEDARKEYVKSIRQATEELKRAAGRSKESGEYERAEARLNALEKKYEEFLREDGLALAGGKGLSLSLMDEVVDVPAGFNVLTTAYFEFVRSNKEIWDVINIDLRNLDAVDDEAREAVSRKIKQIMLRTEIPEHIKEEVLRMYRHLNILRAIAGKQTPTAVAVRSSGIKEDIKVKTWLPITTGSQAGQSDTYLNVKGEKDVLDALRRDWASLFTDRAIVYRDDAIFQIWAGKIGLKDKHPRKVYYELLDKLHEYKEKLNNPEFGFMANALTRFSNPGSVKLMWAMGEILKHEKDNKQILHCLRIMKESAEEFVHPEQIGIDVVIMQMVKSFLAGVIFTVNPATRMAGSAQALNKLWYSFAEDRHSLVYRDEEGNITGTKPVVVSFEISYGYGENVVGGKVNPDKFVMGTYDGQDWFTLEKNKGNKQIQMVNREEAIALLEHVMPKAELESLAEKVGNALSYEEVAKQVGGILSTGLFGTRYLKALPDGKVEKEEDRKKRMHRIARDITDMIKRGDPTGAVKNYVKKEFIVAAPGSPIGLRAKRIDDVLKDVQQTIAEAKEKERTGKEQLCEFFKDGQKADEFILMLKETWENKEYELTKREEILKQLGMTARDSRNLSHLIRAFMDGRFTANIETTDAHRDVFCISDDEAACIARMAWAITTYYRDQRDIEFAIEIDTTAPVSKRLLIYGIDRLGNVLVLKDGQVVKAGPADLDKLGREGRIPARLYNVQARPYTADYAKVDYVQEGRELDDKFIEEKGIKPIAHGTKGDNATHAYVMAFDPHRSIAWHAEEIRRLKRGEFTDEERKRIEEMGFDPDDYGPDSDKQLPLALYLLEADPSHDPLMRLVDAVLTIRGGGTCHAAIFCREQGIPAVTALGKVTIEGHFLRTGDGLTVDANNGRIYKLEATPEKRIPIKYEDFRVKPYGITGEINEDGEVVDEDGFRIPRVGRISASASGAQKSSSIMNAVDSDGNSLTRAEFKGEEIGINIFAGYAYDLLQRIKAGEKRPERVRILEDLLAGRIPAGGEEFVERIGRSICGHLREREPRIFDMFHKSAHAELTPENALRLLIGLDIKRDEELYGSRKKELTDVETESLRLFHQLSKDSRDFLRYMYGVVQRRFNFDFNLLEGLRLHPWIEKEIAAKLKEKGYSSFRGYASKEFYYFYNLMGYTIAPYQKAKNRAYDFAQDKVRGMIGSEVEGTFAWPGRNPLVGLRGTSLEIEGVDEESPGNQRVLDFLLEAVIDANEITHNQAWFYVFVRFAREMKMLDRVFEAIAERKKSLPKQIGIMIEVPSNAILAGELGEALIAMRDKFKKYGTELTFFSFGTNDYSHLLGKCDREDPRIKLVIVDPAALKAIGEMEKAGFLYDHRTRTLPLIDEGSETMLQLMEAVVRVARDLGIPTSLCGEAITSLAARGDYKSAGKILGLLDSFGVSTMKVRLLVSMLARDIIATIKEIDVPEEERQLLLNLKENGGEVFQDEGVIKGEVIYVDSPEDLIPDSLRGFKGAELRERKERLKMQSLESARSTMRTYGKIVVIGRNLVAMRKAEFLEAGMNEGLFKRLQEREKPLIKKIGKDLYVWTNLADEKSKFESVLRKTGEYNERQIAAILAAWSRRRDNIARQLTQRGIDWDDLQYAKAIIVDSDVSLEGWDVFTSEKGIVPTRVKARVRGIARMRKKLEGKEVTIDYRTGNVYLGNLRVRRKEVEPRALPVPKHEPVVLTEAAVREDANRAYTRMKYHPLLLLKYAGGEMESLTKEFDETMGKIIDGLEKIATTLDVDKKKWLLKEFRKKLDNFTDPHMNGIVRRLYQRVAAGQPFEREKISVEELRKKYFYDLRRDLDIQLAGREVRDFIREAFKQQMRSTLAANDGKFVVHTTTSLNSAEFASMIGGFLIEHVSPSPDYGLLGAARALGDFYEINRLELEAFKEVWEELPPEKRKNFGLQITEVRGTQSGAIMIAWASILRDMGIIPGRDLRVGVNIATPADTLSVDRYFDFFRGLGEGLSFVSYDRMNLGAAWAGVDIYWDEWRRLAREEELREIGDVAVRIVKGKIEKENRLHPHKEKTVVTFDEKDPDLARPASDLIRPAVVTSGSESRISRIDNLAQGITVERTAATDRDHIDEIIGEGATGIIAGRYESGRDLVREPDKEINRKIREAHDRGLRTVVLCVGEKRRERVKGVTAAEETIKKQLLAGLKGLTPGQVAGILIAYAPKWAVTGSRFEMPFSPDAVRDRAKFIREVISENFGKETAEKVRILFDGDVTGENAEFFLRGSGIDGFIVNKASTSLDKFMSIVEVVRKAAATAERVPYIIANWKPAGMEVEYSSFVHALKDIAEAGEVQLGFAPPLVKIHSLAEMLAAVAVPAATKPLTDSVPVMESVGVTALGIDQVEVELAYESPDPRKISNAVDVVRLNGGEIEIGGRIFSIIGDRDYVITVEGGSFSVILNGEYLTDYDDSRLVLEEKDQVVVTKEGFRTPDGKQYLFREGARYMLTKATDGQAVIRVDYNRTPEEKAAYAVYEALKEYIDVIESLDKTVEFMVPKVVLGRTSAGILQKSLDKYFGKDRILLRTYNDVNEGLAQDDLKREIENCLERGRIPVLGAMRSDIIQAEEGKDKELQRLLGGVRVLALPDIAPDRLKKPEKGWFPMELVGVALLQAGLTAEAIKKKEPIAVGMQRLMTHLTGRAVAIDSLYYMLPFNDRGIPAQIKPENPFEWMLRLVEKLLLSMPIEAYDPSEDLEMRRKVMYSV